MISAGDAQKRVQAAIDGIVASGAHVLVERGELDYDMRAVEVWPEFGAHGKDRVTLHHVLMHTAGVPAPPYDTTVEDLCDWHHMCDAGVDLVSPARRAVMAAPAFEGPDEVMDVPTTWGVRVQPLPSRRGPVPGGVDLRHGRGERFGGDACPVHPRKPTTDDRSDHG